MPTAKKETNPTSVYSAIAEARKVISKTPMKKEGRNTYSNYDYFTPSQVHKLVEDACQDVGLLTMFDLKQDELGYFGLLTVHHIESDTNRAFEVRTAIPDIKATNASQKLGGMMTFVERYAKMSAFGIVDNNLDFDSQDNRPTQKPIPKNANKESSKEDALKSYLIKQGGLTDGTKTQLKKAIAALGIDKVKEVVVASGLKTITEKDIDGLVS